MPERFEIIPVESQSKPTDQHFLIQEIPAEEAELLAEDMVAYKPVGRPSIIEEISQKLTRMEGELGGVKKDLTSSKKTSVQFTKVAVGFRLLELVQTLHNLEGRLIKKYLPSDFVDRLEEKRFWVLKHYDHPQITEFFERARVIELLDIYQTDNFKNLRKGRNLSAHQAIEIDFADFNVSTEYIDENFETLSKPNQGTYRLEVQVTKDIQKYIDNLNKDDVTCTRLSNKMNKLII